MGSHTLRHGLFEVSLFALLAAFALVAIFPLGWVVSTSLKQMAEVAVWPPLFFSRSPSISAFVGLWSFAPFGTFLMNSVIVATVSASCTMVASSLAAYGLARLRLRGAEFILSAFLISQMFPGASIIVPITQIVVNLGLFNTRAGLILIYTAFLIPFSTWMLYGYFETIPKELEEAGFMDGCSRLESLTRIMLPLSLPGMGATFIFCFLGSWNEYLFALVFANNYTVRTLPVGLGTLIGQYNTSWNILSAAALIFSVPPLVLFILLERSLISGLTAGALKG